MNDTKSGLTTPLITQSAQADFVCLAAISIAMAKQSPWLSWGYYSQILINQINQPLPPNLQLLPQSDKPLYLEIQTSDRFFRLEQMTPTPQTQSPY